jgi:hypothetical protein
MDVNRASVNDQPSITIVPRPPTVMLHPERMMQEKIHQALRLWWHKRGVEFSVALFSTPEHTLHAGNPEDLGNGETGIPETLQVLNDRYREILVIEPCQMILYLSV